MVSSLSSKKRMKTSRQVVKSNLFIRFLEETSAWKKSFRIFLTFSRKGEKELNPRLALNIPSVTLTLKCPTVGGLDAPETTARRRQGERGRGKPYRIAARSDFDGAGSYPRGDRRRGAPAATSTTKQQSATLKVYRSVVTTDAFRTELELWSEFQSEKSVNKYFDQKFWKCTEQDRTYSYYIYVLYRSSFASYIYYILVYGCVCSEILSYFEQRSKSGEFVPFKIVKNW